MIKVKECFDIMARYHRNVCLIYLKLACLYQGQLVYFNIIMKENKQRCPLLSTRVRV